jgi:hypothetical protein
MSAKIIIVGTCHTLQCGVGNYTDKQRDNYKNQIVKLCKTYNVELVAEEMCFYGLSQHEVSETVVANLTKTEIIAEHEYIDIPFEGRALLNIGNASISKFNKTEFSKIRGEIRRVAQFRKRLLDPMRELYWFAKLLDAGKWPALLICGDNHVPNMRRLIRKVNKDACVYSCLSSDYLDK